MKVFLRAWKRFELADIQEHLIVAGELSSECYSCRKIGLELIAKSCPECGSNFQYMSFRRKVTPLFLNKVREQWPEVIFIDFEDFKKSVGKKDARELFDI
ncbi:MAG: hypothetical protein ABIH08_07600 [Candidatus Omnitrophota bacterium]